MSVFAKIQTINRTLGEQSFVISSMENPYKNLEFVPVGIHPETEEIIGFDLKTPRTVYIRPILPTGCEQIDSHADSKWNPVQWVKYLTNENGDYVDERGNVVSKTRRVQKMAHYVDGEGKATLVAEKFSIKFPNSSPEHFIKVELPQERYLLEEYVFRSAFCANVKSKKKLTHDVPLFYVDDDLEQTKKEELQAERQQAVDRFLSEVVESGNSRNFLKWLIALFDKRATEVDVVFAKNATDKIVESKVRNLKDDAREKVRQLIENGDKEDSIQEIVFKIAAKENVILVNSDQKWVVDNGDGTSFTLGTTEKVAVTRLFEERAILQNVFSQVDGLRSLYDFLMENLCGKSQVKQVVSKPEPVHEAATSVAEPVAQKKGPGRPPKR